MAFTISKISSFSAFLTSESLPVDHATWRSNTPAIFIGGCGRSGTTLLRVMLNSHPEVYAGPEMNTHVNLLERLDRYPFLPRRAYLLHDHDELMRLARRFELTFEKVMQCRVEAACLADFLDRLLREASRSHGAPRWAEKTPKNCTILPFLSRYFPQMHFVHVIRDGRDVVISLRHHPRFREDGTPTNITRPISECLARWLGDTQAALAFRNEPWYHEVRYEELLERPEEVLTKLCADIGLQFDTSMLTYDTSEKRPDTAHFLPSANATQALDRSRTGRWRSELSTEDARYIAREGGALLRELGYAQDDTWVGEIHESS